MPGEHICDVPLCERRQRGEVHRRLVVLLKRVVQRFCPRQTLQCERGQPLLKLPPLAYLCPSPLHQRRVHRGIQPYVPRPGDGVPRRDKAHVQLRHEQRVQLSAVERTAAQDELCAQCLSLLRGDLQHRVRAAEAVVKLIDKFT